MGLFAIFGDRGDRHGPPVVTFVPSVLLALVAVEEVLERVPLRSLYCRAEFLVDFHESFVELSGDVDLLAVSHLRLQKATSLR